MADDKVRVLFRGGSHDGETLQMTRDQRLVTTTIHHPDAKEVYVPTGETEDHDGVSLPVYRPEQDA
jgi:hypothetical protein